MDDSIAFLDEQGNTSLDFTQPGTSTHFIVAALVLRKSELAQAQTHLEALGQRYFQTGPINSASVGSDDKRRTLVLGQLLALPLQIVALVVDKRELKSEGFYHKGSLFKFLHGLADRELHRHFPNLELVAGRPGEDTFMKGFVQFVHDRHIPTLFDQASFRFVPGVSSLLNQAADFVAGSLARCYEQTAPSPAQAGLRQLLSPKLLALTYWPERFAPLVARPLPGQTTYNASLAELCLQLGQDFLHRKLSSRAPQEIDQVTCLQYLIFHFRHVDPTRYISSRELLAHVQERRGQTPSLHYFQTRVIAPLRDAGVLIASSSKGYKIPACEGDLYDFVNHSNTIIQPLLSRIGKCRDRIYQATSGTIDLLAREEYANLHQLLAYPDSVKQQEAP
ncbi:DUF3800 domain-containing protein [Fibrella forsythiae]|uniref:DUF3800 domain-containing protein n=1 Tax=Fibrella forsythiae TaxID=2817061 RepID=A0ABS3JT08_9BACT|nr:DUF3800 domain-containing protein [Fibrella forsythiae]MBO0953137.1 DUF3800 domain-containing protein [Fibrella forsythiae]